MHERARKETLWYSIVLQIAQRPTRPPYDSVALAPLGIIANVIKYGIRQAKARCIHAMGYLFLLWMVSVDLCG